LEDETRLPVASGPADSYQMTVRINWNPSDAVLHPNKKTISVYYSQRKHWSLI